MRACDFATTWGADETTVPRQSPASPFAGTKALGRLTRLFVSFSCHALAAPACLAEASGEGGSKRILNQIVRSIFMFYYCGEYS
jgi:hypothetical protein